MNRAFAIAACLLAATVLLPASAEAKRRFSGSAAQSATSSSTGRSTVIVPATAGARARAAEPAEARRVPFPPATAQPREPSPVPLRLTGSDDKPVWCRSEVVVGGFCMVN